MFYKKYMVLILIFSANNIMYSVRGTTMKREIYSNQKHIQIPDTMASVNLSYKTFFEPHPSYMQSGEMKSVCESEFKHVPVFIGPKIKKGSKYMKNIKERYMLPVKVEVCKNESTPCKIQDNLINGYTSKCKQHYIKKRVVIKGILVNDLLIEAGCKCVINLKKYY